MLRHATSARPALPCGSALLLTPPSGSAGAPGLWGAGARRRRKAATGVLPCPSLQRLRAVEPLSCEARFHRRRCDRAGLTPSPPAGVHEDEKEGSLEYLVYASTLAAVAAQQGLTPVTDWGSPELDACFDEARAGPGTRARRCAYGPDAPADE